MGSKGEFFFIRYTQTMGELFFIRYKIDQPSMLQMKIWHRSSTFKEIFISRLDPNTGNISVGIQLNYHGDICLLRPARLSSDFSLAFKCLNDLCVRSGFLKCFAFHLFEEEKVT